MRNLIIAIRIGIIMTLSFGCDTNKINDIDGNKYKVVIIGKQKWMAENLNVTHFINGDPIQQVITDDEWVEYFIKSHPAWSYYDNNKNYGRIYGKLYNGWAVRDKRGLCPEGWRIPSDDDWTMLTNYLGGDHMAGRKLKYSRRWVNNGNGSNESGFSALPGGFRMEIPGVSLGIGWEGFWWSSSENGPMNWARILNSNEDSIERESYFRGNGFSVRCIKE